MTNKYIASDIASALDNWGSTLNKVASSIGTEEAKQQATYDKRNGDVQEHDSKVMNAISPVYKEYDKVSKELELSDIQNKYNDIHAKASIEYAQQPEIFINTMNTYKNELLANSSLDLNTRQRLDDDFIGKNNNTHNRLLSAKNTDIQRANSTVVLKDIANTQQDIKGLNEQLNKLTLAGDTSSRAYKQIQKAIEDKHKHIQNKYNSYATQINVFGSTDESLEKVKIAINYDKNETNELTAFDLINNDPSKTKLSGTVNRYSIIDGVRTKVGVINTYTNVEAQKYADNFLNSEHPELNKDEVINIYNQMVRKIKDRTDAMSIRHTKPRDKNPASTIADIQYVIDNGGRVDKASRDFVVNKYKGKNKTALIAQIDATNMYHGVGADGVYNAKNDISTKPYTEQIAYIDAMTPANMSAANRAEYDKMNPTQQRYYGERLRQLRLVVDKLHKSDAGTVALPKDDGGYTIDIKNSIDKHRQEQVKQGNPTPRVGLTDEGKKVFTAAIKEGDINKINNVVTLIKNNTRSANGYKNLINGFQSGSKERLVMTSVAQGTSITDAVLNTSPSTAKELTLAMDVYKSRYPNYTGNTLRDNAELLVRRVKALGGKIEKDELNAQIDLDVSENSKAYDSHWYDISSSDIDVELGHNDNGGDIENTLSSMKNVFIHKAMEGGKLVHAPYSKGFNIIRDKQVVRGPDGSPVVWYKDTPELLFDGKGEVMDNINIGLLYE